MSWGSLDAFLGHVGLWWWMGFYAAGGFDVYRYLRISEAICGEMVLRNDIGFFGLWIGPLTVPAPGTSWTHAGLRRVEG